jgi:hypothetical protein
LSSGSRYGKQGKEDEIGVSQQLFGNLLKSFCGLLVSFLKCSHYRKGTNAPATGLLGAKPSIQGAMMKKVLDKRKDSC